MTAYQKEYGPKGEQEQGGKKARYMKICKTKLEEEDARDIAAEIGLPKYLFGYK